MTYHRFERARVAFVILALGGAGATATNARAQATKQGADVVRDVSDLSLEQLLESSTTVASSKATSLRESPGVITVVTHTDIERMGARDLLDILQMVPGFDFGVDVTGGVGVGFRGNWGHEGKVLLLWDGLEMNETLYYTLVFGHHFPVHDIDRIEIIRGPGSAIYGGAGELAVINVITRTGAQRQSVGAYGSLGATQESLPSLATGGVTYGQNILDGLDITADIYGGYGVRSDAIFTDVHGQSYDMTGSSQLDPLWASLSARWLGIESRLIVDGFHTTMRDGYSDILPKTFPMDFPAWFFTLKYDWRLGDTLTLTPRFDLKRQNPWRDLEAEPPVQLNVLATRARGSLTLSWDALDNLNLQAGVDGFVDHVQDGTDSVPGTLLDVSLADYGDDQSTFENGAAFGQLLLRTSIVNITAGARAEVHSISGPSFVPRVALTKVLDRVHVKALVSGAFKSPSIYDIIVSPDVRPEKARVIEGEIGLQATDYLYVSANAFDITINDPIVYKYDEALDSDTFVNFTQTGSRGVELEAWLQLPRMQASMSYSFYSSQGKNEVDLYQVPGHPELNLGFPAHKLTANVTVDLMDKLSASTSVVLRSQRFAETSVDDDGNPIFHALAPTCLLNAGVLYKDAFTPGLDLALNAYNILGDPIAFPEPYIGDHAPLPAFPTEAVASVSYRFGL